MTNEELLKEIALLPDDSKRKVEEFITSLKKSFRVNSSNSTPFREEVFFGMWKDREDIKDSVEWVREVRRTHWKS
jgi:hypothetical protein